MIRGQAAPNDVVDLDGADVSGISIVLTDRPLTALSGVVRDDRAALRPGASVYLFPTNRDLWVDFGPIPRRFRLVRSDRAGRYTLSAPAGDYFVSAVASEVADLWMGSPFLEALAKTAIVVHVASAPIVVPDLTVR